MQGSSPPPLHASLGAQFSGEFSSSPVEGFDFSGLRSNFAAMSTSLHDVEVQVNERAVDVGSYEDKNVKLKKENLDANRAVEMKALATTKVVVGKTLNESVSRDFTELPRVGKADTGSKTAPKNSSTPKGPSSAAKTRLTSPPPELLPSIDSAAKEELENELRISREAQTAAFAAERASALARAEELQRRLKRKEAEKRDAVADLETMKKTLRQKEMTIQNLVEKAESGQGRSSY